MTRIKLKDLWIGDQVKLLKSGLVGIFSGITEDGKARIKIQDRIIITTENNLTLMTEIKNPTPDLDLTPPIQKVKTKICKNKIDLHLDVLDPDHRISAVRALDFQVEKCREFLHTAISCNLSKVIIIHGKGEGVLKESISHLLKTFPEVQFVFPAHQGGATEVWLQKRQLT